MMKSKYLFLFAAIVLLSVSSCESDGHLKNPLTVKRNPEYLPPVEVAIAPSIKEDAELVDMVQSSEKAINEFSDNIERLAQDGKKILAKMKDDQSMGNGLRAMKLLMEFSSNSSNMVKTGQKFEEYLGKRKDQGSITDDQIEALDEVSKALTGRLKELVNKYQKLFNELEQ